MLTPEMIAQGWLPHDGGPCPVPLGSYPRVLFQDGSESDDVTAGERADNKYDRWQHKGPWHDRIIAYLPDPDYPTEGAGNADP